MLLARKSSCDCAAIRRKRQKTSTNGYTTKRCHSDEKQKFVVPSEASEPAKRMTTDRKSEKRGQSWVKCIYAKGEIHDLSEECEEGRGHLFAEVVLCSALRRPPRPSRFLLYQSYALWLQYLTSIATPKNVSRNSRATIKIQLIMLRVLLIHVSYLNFLEYSINGEVLSHDRLPQ